RLAAGSCPGLRLERADALLDGVEDHLVGRVGVLGLGRHLAFRRTGQHGDYTRCAAGRQGRDQSTTFKPAMDWNRATDRVTRVNRRSSAVAAMRRSASPTRC